MSRAPNASSERVMRRRYRIHSQTAFLQRPPARDTCSRRCGSNRRSRAWNGRPEMTNDSSVAAGKAQARANGQLAASPGQIVVVFQGGGALGAYQAGVYQALHEAGIEPDWMIGTSIGAINASLIAGNETQNRLPALREFWQRMADRSLWHAWPAWPQMVQTLSYWK